MGEGGFAMQGGLCARAFECSLCRVFGGNRLHKLGRSAPITWLVAKWGGVRFHETAISHIRRLLDTEFTCELLRETTTQLKERMAHVVCHVNSKELVADGGAGLDGLAKKLHACCEQVIANTGARLRK